MKKQLIIIGAIFVFILIVGSLSPAPVVVEEQAVYESTLLAVGSTTVRAQVAISEEAKALGLSGRVSLGADDGMLFIFDAPSQPGFWMKDMLLPIDIIWIGEDYTIVDITKKVLPDSYPTLFSPKAPAQFVLEVNAGWVDEHGIAIGDSVAPVPGN